MSDMPKLQLEQLAFEPILKPVTLWFQSGRVVGLIGPNGAGKSTLLKTVAGILPKTAGRIEVDGVDLAGASSKERARKIAYLPQSLSEDIPYSVREFVEMGRYSHQSMWADIPSTGRRAVESALFEMGLSGFADVPLNRVSGGERQRAGIARCLAQESSILLLDEPISNLDIFYQLDIMTRLSELAERGSLLLVAIHHLEFALRFCDDLLVLSDGHLVAFGPVADVFNPALVRDVFRVDARMFEDPILRHPRLSLSMTQSKDDVGNVRGKAAKV